jgi:hypothetical protein
LTTQNYASWWTTSICIGPDDLPGVAYKDPNSYEVKYAYHDGVSWHVDIVDSLGGSVRTQKALDIDSLGKPYFIYSPYLAYKDSSGWYKEELPLEPPLTIDGAGALRIGYDGTIHIARIAINNDYTYSEIHYIYGTPEGIEEKTQIINSKPQIQNIKVFPNPFKYTTNIRFQIVKGVDSRQNSVVSIKIYDATGKLVKDFRPIPSEGQGLSSQGNRAPNTLRLTHISWDGTDQANRQLPSGVYFVTLRVEDYSETQKLLLIE